MHRRGVVLTTVLTMAGHKGYALAMMVEAFQQRIVGRGNRLLDWLHVQGPRQKAGRGPLFCLFNIAAFMDLDEFKKRMDETIDRLKGGRKCPGVEEILVPWRALLAEIR